MLALFYSPLSDSEYWVWCWCPWSIWIFVQEQTSGGLVWAVWSIGGVLFFTGLSFLMRDRTTTYMGMTVLFHQLICLAIQLGMCKLHSLKPVCMCMYVVCVWAHILTSKIKWSWEGEKEAWILEYFEREMSKRHYIKLLINFI